MEISSLFRYHNICHKRFTNSEEIKSVKECSQELPDQSSMAYVLRSMRNEPERTWTSTKFMRFISLKGPQTPLVFAFSNHWKKL